MQSEEREGMREELADEGIGDSHTGEQRRRDDVPVRDNGGRLRDAVANELSRPLPADASAAAENAILRTRMQNSERVIVCSRVYVIFAVP